MSSDPRRLRGLVWLLAAVVLLPACGRKGDPAPPLRFIPAPTQDLTVAQQGRELVLTLAYPQATEAGHALPDLHWIEVWELTRDLPAAAPAEEPGEAEEPASPRTPTPQEFETNAELEQTFQGEELSRSVVGERLVFRRPLPDDAPPLPQAWTYGTRSATSDRDVSRFSNLATLVPLYPPPEPPTGFEVEPQAQGIEVRWQPAEIPEGAGAPVGYHVYRRDPRSRFWGQPLTLAPPAETRYLDTTALVGESYVYGVTTVVSATPLVESAPGGASEIEYLDRFPPTAPAEPVALVETGRVRLVWEAPAAADLAGYHVYRRRPGAEPEQLTEAPIPRTEYTDRQVATGETFLYQVTAVDRAGNEGQPSAPVRAEIP